MLDFTLLRKVREGYLIMSSLDYMASGSIYSRRSDKLDTYRFKSWIPTDLT